MKRELLIGCGNSSEKTITGGSIVAEWENLTRLDIDPDCNPDVLWDLDNLPLPFEDNTFDEIHAYEVLEHTGRQGDWRFFFAQFAEFWRILKPDGVLAGTCPKWNSIWAWGDPGHTRVLSAAHLIFLCQSEYKQVGKTRMTDYRSVYKADFKVESVDEWTIDPLWAFVLRAVK